MFHLDPVKRSRYYSDGRAILHWTNVRSSLVDIGVILQDIHISKDTKHAVDSLEAKVSPE